MSKNKSCYCFGFLPYIAALYLITTHSLAAEIMSANSVESLTSASEVVAVGRLTKVSNTKPPGGASYTDCVLEVSEIIKGAPTNEISFCCRELPDEKSAWLTPGKELLVMLSRGKDSHADPRLANILVPTSYQMPFSIIDLSKPLKNLYTSDLLILKDNSDLLSVCRVWASSSINLTLEREVPVDSPIFGELFGGSSVYLVVPAEQKYRKQYFALARSEKPYERKSAAAELWKFPGQDTVKVLRDLLSDQTEEVWSSSNDTIAKIKFGVREAAYRSLQKLGEQVPQIELERDPTTAELSQHRHEAWQKSFKEALPSGWITTEITDGDSMDNWDGKKTIVLVTCSNGSTECRWILIPREWDKTKLPKTGYAGMFEGDSQGGRYFYLEGDIPEDVKSRLIQYFELVTSKS